MVADPASIGRDVEIGYRNGRVARESRCFPRVDIERPQAGEGRGHVPDGDVELLFHAEHLVLVEGVGSDEIDAPAIGRPFPEAYTGLLMGELHRLRGINPRDRQRIKLLFLSLSAAVNEPPAILAEVERRNALLCIGDLPRFTTVGAHDIDLILACRICATRARASCWRRRSSISVRAE